MSRSVGVALVLLVGACGEHATTSTGPRKDPMTSVDQPSTPPAPPAPPAPRKTVTVSMFGEVAIADGAIIAMDGGIHGIQGHTLSVSATNDATWERRLDGMQPNGKAGTGALALTTDELAHLRGWADGAWRLASKGTAAFSPPISDGPPRWVWAIVLRRGDEVRVLHGGGLEPPAGAPDPADKLLGWLVSRVDAAAAAAP